MEVILFWKIPHLPSILPAATDIRATRSSSEGTRTPKRTNLAQASHHTCDGRVMWSLPVRLILLFEKGIVNESSTRIGVHETFLQYHLPQDCLEESSRTSRIPCSVAARLAR
ncbi:hypothetical protein TNCV_4215611 [Trichonephila clavipes]|nr:hypothetical protein TNCV_4215611 [Trichonephila clavipes]